MKLLTWRGREDQKEQEQKDKDKKVRGRPQEGPKVGWHSHSGTGTDGKSMEVVIQKDGTVIWRIGGQPEVRGTLTGDESKLELDS